MSRMKNCLLISVKFKGKLFAVLCFMQYVIKQSVQSVHLQISLDLNFTFLLTFHFTAAHNVKGTVLEVAAAAAECLSIIACHQNQCSITQRSIFSLAASCPPHLNTNLRCKTRYQTAAKHVWFVLRMRLQVFLSSLEDVFLEAKRQ